MDELLRNCTKEACLEMARTCAAFNLRRAARKVTQHFDRYLAPTGLKVTQFSLLVVAFLEERQPLNKLASVMGMDRTTLSRNIKVLEKRGLISMASGEDQREVRVYLTDAGREAMDEAAPLWHEAQEQILEGLGDVRWQAVVGDLRAMGKSIKE